MRSRSSQHCFTSCHSPLYIIFFDRRHHLFAQPSPCSCHSLYTSSWCDA